MTDHDSNAAAHQVWARDLGVAMQELDDEQNAVLQLVYGQGLSQKQAATRLSWPPEVVATQLANALQRLGGLLIAESADARDVGTLRGPATSI